MAGQYFVLRLVRARRLHGVARVLALVAAGGARRVDGDRPDRRAARRRRGLRLPARGRQPGDELEVRGPVGAFFAWNGHDPALLVAGGSGIVPLMAMLRRPAGPAARTSCVCSCPCARRATSTSPTSSPGPRRPSPTRGRPRRAPRGRRPARARRRRSAGARRGGRSSSAARRAFAEAATTLLLEAGVPVGAIRVERFGPWGLDDHERETAAATRPGRRARRTRSGEITFRPRRRGRTAQAGGTQDSLPTQGVIAMEWHRGRPRPPSVPLSAPWPWSWAWRRSASSPPVSGAVAAGPLVGTGAAGSVGAHDIRRGAAGTCQGVEPRLVARSAALQPAVGQAPVDLRRRAAEPVRQARGRHGVRRLVHLPRPAPRLGGPAAGTRQGRGEVDAVALQLAAQLLLDAEPAGGGGHLQPDRRQRLALQREAGLERARGAEVGAQDPGVERASRRTGRRRRRPRRRPATAPCARAPTPAAR